jgi:superfamily I DNA and RNA helicase
MSLEIVHGESRFRTTALALADTLKSVVSTGTIYLGYPILTSADDQVEVGALLVSRDHGLVAFLLGDTQPSDPVEWMRYVDDQDRLYAILESNLSRHESLRQGRKLRLDVNTATVFPSAVKGAPEGTDARFLSIDDVAVWVESLIGIEEGLERALQGALQRVSTMKPAKRRASVKKKSSRGAVLKSIERGFANLDRWQKRAAIESPDGPQRIRGLAGSGKTIVLSLKASYLHAQHPQWKIALTFHSRALYQQMEDLVTRFSFEHANDRPDPEFLQIMHTWGSPSRSGVYSTIASVLGVTPRDYSYAAATYGRDNAFQGVCQELLAVAEQREVKPIFDAVLIDEAQDLPPEFFQLVYRFTKEPKRIIWGFDELQKLSESAMPGTDELFGRGPQGQSLVSLETAENEPRRDIILPVCYRNTPWALATGHALGIGVYREEGLLQHFDEPNLWGEIGYRVVQGTLAPGCDVMLERSRNSYPGYFDELLKPDDSVLLMSFKDQLAQDSWIAGQIEVNLSADELEHDDILVVLPDAYSAKSRANSLMSVLRQRGIASHLVGVGSSVDAVFVKGSIAIAHIHRAKGNEAPMVYVIDAQHAASQFNPVTRRNTLFTAITRSRAWVRILGWGDGMETIRHEVRNIQDSSYRLKFRIPTESELVRLRRLNRDRPGLNEQSVKKATAGLQAFLDAYRKQEIDLTDLPPELRTLVTKLREEFRNDDE